jgi:hypothetical protein
LEEKKLKKKENLGSKSEVPKGQKNDKKERKDICLRWELE